MLFITTDEISVRVRKITPRIGVSWTHSLPLNFYPILTHWIMAILSKGFKPHNFEWRNSIELSFTNIQGLHSNFVDCESFIESKSSDINALCETNLSHTFYEGRTPFCMVLISRKLCRFLLKFSTAFFLLPLLITFFVFMHGFWFCFI